LSRLVSEDLQLVDEWGRALAHNGTAPSRIGRLTKRVRGFARVTQGGLLKASREDIAAFAVSRAARLPGEHIDPLKLVLRGRALRETVVALRAFYGWCADRGLIDLRRAPIAGLRLPPPASREPLRIVQARFYDITLHQTGPPHYRAVVWLLAFGLEPLEIVRLRATDVDLERREILLPSRTMPLTNRAVEALRPWVELRQRFSVGGWLFTGKRGRPASRFCVHDAVRRLAPRPTVRACGFRELLIARAFRRGIAADCVPGLLGVQLPRRLRPYVGVPTPERLYAELHRITRRWRRWIG
jgi:integrase